MVLGCPELGKLLFWERLSETYEYEVCCEGVDSRRLKLRRFHRDTEDVLGLEMGDKTQFDVLAVLAEYKDADNMTEERNIQVCNS